MDYYLSKSENSKKKFDVFCYIGRKRLWKISFGENGANDYTKFKTLEEAEKHKKAYILRHKGKEKWGENGIKTAGWWSYWILWNKRTYVDSIKETARKFEISIIVAKPPAAVYYDAPKRTYYRRTNYSRFTPREDPVIKREIIPIEQKKEECDVETELCPEEVPPQNF